MPLHVEIESTCQGFDLWFVLERSDRRVLCKVSDNLADRFTAERYELDALDRKTVEQKTASFVESIFEYLANEGRL